MTLAMIFIDKRKKLNEYMGKGDTDGLQIPPLQGSNVCED